jgi:hypothetical protein
VLLREEIDVVVLAQQQRLHAGAVDEQVAFQRAVAQRLQRGDVAVVARVDAGDVVRHVAHAKVLQAMLAQEHAELAGVEVVAVVGHRGELRRGGLLGRLALRAQVRLEADQVGERHAGVARQPVFRQVHVAIALRQHERMEIIVVVGTVAPAVKARALLERGVAFAEEVRFGHADAAQRVAHARPRAFADADRGDVGRFDQRHLQGGGRRCRARTRTRRRSRRRSRTARAVIGRDQAGGQPAGRSASHDHDASDHVIAHWNAPDIVQSVTDKAADGQRPFPSMVVITLHQNL